MDQQHAKAIQAYQCCGCLKGPFPTCYKPWGDSIGCHNHVPGTIIIPIGRVFLGMPTGFCRLGKDDLRLNLFASWEQRDGWEYNEWNVPVWKYLSPEGHTFVRGLSPRNNFPFLHVYLENVMDKINCREITQADVDGMD